VYLFFKNGAPKRELKVDASCLCVKTRVPRLTKSLHSFLWRTYTLFGGFYTEYFLYKDNKLLSRAEVVSKIPVLPFMSADGVHIGPCVTEADERGKEYYPYLLNIIQMQYKNKVCYMIVEEHNSASIRGVQKAGFRCYARGRKTKTRRYIIENTEC